MEKTPSSAKYSEIMVCVLIINIDDPFMKVSIAVLRASVLFG